MGGDNGENRDIYEKAAFVKCGSHRIPPAGSAAWTYDYENRMLTSTTPQGSASFVYNGDGLRVRKVEGIYAANFLYEGVRLYAKCDDNWNIGVRFMMEGGSYYDPLTAIKVSSTRYYNPLHGRFTTPDPLRGDVNSYAYVAGAPTVSVDPAGLRHWPYIGGCFRALLTLSTKELFCLNYHVKGCERLLEMKINDKWVHCTCWCQSRTTCGLSESECRALAPCWEFITGSKPKDAEPDIQAGQIGCTAGSPNLCDPSGGDKCYNGCKAAGYGAFEPR